VDPIGLLISLARLFQFILLARVLIGWIQVDPYHPIVQILYRITEPLLEPIRQVMPQGTGVDFSPLIAMILVQVVVTIVAGTL
jgi:YggT family protein